MAIKLKKTVKKFSSTKPAWDELENSIKENCSEPIKKLIEAGESQDKIKDTVNYLIDHIMEGDSESREYAIAPTARLQRFADHIERVLTNEIRLQMTDGFNESQIKKIIKDVVDEVMTKAHKSYLDE